MYMIKFTNEVDPLHEFNVTDIVKIVSVIFNDRYRMFPRRKYIKQNDKTKNKIKQDAYLLYFY